MNNQHTVTRTYDLQLTANETVHLRLTVAAQLRLKIDLRRTPWM